MAAKASKNALLYDELRLALQSGRYLPGEHIDPHALARDYATSPTPVLHALFRLVGEGVLAGQARGGFYVPPVHFTEAALRDLYDGMKLLLLNALERGSRPPKIDGQPHEVFPRDGGSDIAMATLELFERMASATGNQWLHEMVQITNEKFLPIRRIEQGLIKGAATEITDLFRRWHRGDTKALKAALNHYFERRQHLVPNIATLLESTTPHTRA